jgi:hypothetical protein
MPIDTTIALVEALVAAMRAHPASARVQAASAATLTICARRLPHMAAAL